MKRRTTMRVFLGFAPVALAVLVTLAAWVPSSRAADSGAVVVGRVYHIEGELLRYVPEERDWVPVVRDVPFSNEDVFFSGSRGMAELIVPNGTWIRIGESTQIQCIALDEDLTEMDVAMGLARFYNRGSRTVIKATSAFGYVFAYPGAVFDFYVGENSVEVVAVQGRVTFVHAATDARYDVSAGYPSILADEARVSSAAGSVDPDWDRWNKDRDVYWAAKARVRGPSAGYLPPNLRDESYALDENGTWEMVPYEGANRWFWRPTRVGPGWSPFTVGRWTYWYGDQCWIPAEPFGYITHHYGNWVYARNRWYWAPPVAVVRVGLPFLNVGFFWYPGRVAWIHSGPYVGWVPLAPREPYYCNRHWGGPHTVVVTNRNVAQINIHIRNYAYAGRAIVVNERHFHTVNDYRHVRSSNVHATTIINNYRAAPVINNTVINQYTTIRERHNYTNQPAREKPHQTVINRIEQNERVVHKGRNEDAAVLQEQVKRLPEGRPNREVRVDTPRSANYAVPATDVNRQTSDLKFQQREIKRSQGERPQTQPAPKSERTAPPRPAAISQPAKPQPAKPQPAQPAQPGARPERVTPARPAGTPQQPVTPLPTTSPPTTPPPSQAGQPQQPAGSKQTKPERTPPARIEQPDARWERVTPSQPPVKPDEQRGDQAQPAAAKPVRVSPSRPQQPAQQSPQPAQPAQPGARPERVTPARPAGTPQQPVTPLPTTSPPTTPPPSQAGQPQPPAGSKPTRPEGTLTQPQPPAAKPERVAPAKPVQQSGDQPQPSAVRPERAAPSAPSGQPEPVQPGQPKAKDQESARGRIEQAPETVQPGQPSGRPERVPPARPGQLERFQNEPVQRQQIR